MAIDLTKYEASRLAFKRAKVELRLLYVSAVLLLAALPHLALAQGTIQGTVTDDELADPLPGVNVVILELDRGAATGVDGTYEIVDVPAGTYAVEARYIGFEPVRKEVTVADGETTTVDFALSSSTLEMDEVIVTGTGGNARRREIGNSIAQIDAAQIEATPTTDFGDLLQGRSAGVTIMDNSGQAGAGATIRLRGVNSVTQGNTPLIYIDGVRVTSSPLGADPETNQASSALNDINPDDILRIEVIKGPAATTLFGTEASSGVIQVFTKRGASGRPQVDFAIRQGVNNMGTAGRRRSASTTARASRAAPRAATGSATATSKATTSPSGAARATSTTSFPASGAGRRGSSPRRAARGTPSAATSTSPPLRASRSPSTTPTRIVIRAGSPMATTPRGCS